jgi:hypothetical protein
MATKDSMNRPTGTAQTDDLAALQAQGLKALTGMNTAWMEALGEMGTEVMTFLADRIQEDVRTQHMLLQCRDAGELQRIQAEFIRTAIEHYTAETGKLVEIGQKIFAIPEDAYGNGR